VRAPKNLNSGGKRAWREAKQVIEELNAPEGLFEEAASRYAFACHLSHLLWLEWCKLGSPVLAKGGRTGREVVVHPLIDAMSQARKTAARFGDEFGLSPMSRKKLRGAMGRPQERVPARQRAEGGPPKVVPLRGRRRVSASKRSAS
jgi:P27 family predicted phage terminase small subunit